MDPTRWLMGFLLVTGLLGDPAAIQGLEPAVVQGSTGAASEVKNLLPNASFELSFGEEPRQPTNWGDILNALTINLAATDQQPDGWPPQRVKKAAVHGDYVAQILLDPGSGKSEGHLTSPVLTIQGGQVYTLSAYVKSDVPSASVQLSFWTRPLDWRQVKAKQPSATYRGPDAQSRAIGLTGQWQRFEFTFVAEHLVSIGVVDLLVSADRPGTAWVDAVQLERGPGASTFETRYPVEVALAGRRTPPMLHLFGERLAFHLATYNSHPTPLEVKMRLTVTTPEGLEVLNGNLQRLLPPGYHEQRLLQPFERVGEFRARVASARGDPIGLEEYLFVVHPVMNRDFQGITYSRRGRLKELPAERSWLPWKDSDNFFADPQANLTVTTKGVIYAPLKGRAVSVTRDGGRTWDLIDSGRALLSVLPDGTFLNSSYQSGRLTLNSSSDEGKSWTALGAIEVTGPQAGPVTQLKDKTLIWPIAHPSQGPFTVFAYRSQDGGRSWLEAFPICPGGEPAVIQLQSGRLLAVARHNPSRAEGEWAKYLRNEFPWLLWQRATTWLDHHRNNLTSYEKNLLMADSDDAGVTWKNPRSVTHLLDEMHGSAVELPDRRIVLLYVHRLPSLRGGERARVSRDGGYTWEEELYYLNTVAASNSEEVLSFLEKAEGGVFTWKESRERGYQALNYFNGMVNHPGYSTSCVLPPELGDGKPGMILTVVGERGGKDHPAMMQAVRWRPLP